MEAGGETAFPAAHGARSMAEAMRLKEPSREGGGLVVPPERGAALLWCATGPVGPVRLGGSATSLTFGLSHVCQVQPRP